MIDKESLAIVFCIKKFKQYIKGRKFTILTDHKPLIFILSKKQKLDKLLPRRLRWMIYLNNYDFEILYKKGLENNNADALSRVPIQEDKNVLNNEN